MNYQTTKAIINNENDYSNILPVIECITYLVEYCNNIYKQYIKLCEDDELKNKQFKPEYKDYMFKKSYGSTFEVNIKEEPYNNIRCEDIETFKTAILDGNLKSVAGLNVKMDINFKRGRGEKLEEHENSFCITFKPYEIKFTRKSNHNDSNMNEIEKILKKYYRSFQLQIVFFVIKRNLKKIK